MNTLEIPPLMHGNNWQGQNVAGWWASEKFNGWRAYWTGSRLVSRQGRDYAAPAGFTAALPRFALDCELWLGRGFNNDDVGKAVRAKRWDALFIVAFDVPGTVAETGIQILQSLTPAGSLIIPSFWRVESATDAKVYMRDIVAHGGEGIMLRRPGSLYVNTRCNDLLKLKP